MFGAERDETDGELAPIDYLALAFPRGEIGAEGFAILLDLVDRGVIAILDVEFVAKADDGAVVPVAPADLTPRVEST